MTHEQFITLETATHECFVSSEVAELLREAGFDWEVYRCYETLPEKKKIFGRHLVPYQGKAREDVLPAPTLDVAQRWLREVKGMCLTIQPLFDKVNGQFNVVVGFTPFIHRMDGEMIIVSLDSEHTYEEAQEASIKKALEIILQKEKL